MPRSKLFSRLLAALALTSIGMWIGEKRLSADPKLAYERKLILRPVQPPAIQQRPNSENVSVCQLAFENRLSIDQKSIDHYSENSRYLEQCCDRLYAGDHRSILAASSINIEPNDTVLLNRLETCDRFFEYYSSYLEKMENTNDDDDKDFSIAYSILVHRDLHHLESLLRSIYRPQNFYCIHVDKKSIGLESKVRKLARCLPNVFLSSRNFKVVWGHNGILRATLTCLKDLLHYPKWSYFINLSAQDFPLKTNRELIRILKSWKNRSSIEIAGPASKQKIDYHYRLKYNRFGNPDSVFRGDKKTTAPPFNATITKGNLACILTRQLSQWIIGEKKVAKLFSYLSDAANPDEYFWQTIVSNRKEFGLKKEISQLIDPYYVRYSLWKGDQKKKCKGKFIRDVCIFGVGDLRKLANIRKYLFVNKLYSGYQTPAYECLAMRHAKLSESDDK